MAHPPHDMSRQQFIQAVDAVILARKSRKILAGAELGWDDVACDEPTARGAFEEQVREAIAVAGWAPFHYSQAAQTGVAEPWRFHVLARPAIDGLLTGALASDTSKLTTMLRGAGVVVLATWVRESDDSPAARARNEEHLAAASAAVQNLLLAAEARGMGTYWSSGGKLRDEEIRALLAIASNEAFLGAIFLGAPLPNHRESTEGFCGANRARRTPAEQWSRWIYAVDSP